MEHHLKCWPEYFRATKANIKPFEIRKWDRPYKVDDILFLHEYDPKTQEYTNDIVIKKITYLFDMTYLPGDDRPLFNGYVVLGLKDVEV